MTDIRTDLSALALDFGDKLLDRAKNAAQDEAEILKWGAAASSADFDEFIPANQTRQYVRPSGTSSVQFIEESATAKLAVIEK